MDSTHTADEDAYIIVFTHRSSSGVLDSEGAPGLFSGQARAWLKDLRVLLGIHRRKRIRARSNGDQRGGVAGLRPMSFQAGDAGWAFCCKYQKETCVNLVGDGSSDE